MPIRGTDGIFRTQPVETRHNGAGAGDSLPVAATDVMDEASSAGWNAWLRGHLDIEREGLIETMGGVVAAIRREYEEPLAAQAKRIKALELQLAETRGALDVLRGKGVPGLPRVMGTFIPDATYNYLDIVAKNGSSFVALKDRPGECPGDDWQLLASAGKRGPRGERGLQGHAGVAGASFRWLSFDAERLAIIVTMSDGASKSIPLRALFSDVKLDRKNYSVVFVAADGAELGFSLRELFQQFHEETRGG